MNIMKMVKKGKWLVTMEDNTKFVIDFDDMTWDSYEWYKKVGTLESDFEYIKQDNFFKEVKYMKK